MTQVSCPRCKCALEVSVDAEYGARTRGTDYRVEAVPLRDQPCTADTIGPRPEWYTWPNTDRRGVECNWLGAGCNVTAHVTPVTPARVTLRAGRLVFADVFGTATTCGYVNGALSHDAVWLVPGLARCVQGK